MASARKKRNQPKKHDNIIQEIVSLGLIIGGLLLAGYLQPPYSQATELRSVSPPDTSTEVKVLRQPKQLQIPKIELKATIEQVGLNAQGVMAEPKNSQNIGWYEYSANPGAPGNSVMIGHLNTPTSWFGVFRRLGELSHDDEIIVADTLGQQAVFQVSKVKQYRTEEVPLPNIFSRNGESTLILITCSGIWNTKTGTYTHRLIVFATKK